MSFKSRKHRSGSSAAPADVTAPTLVSATVQNSTPSQIDLVFSEAMNATWSAFGAFGVSAGHNVTGITRTGPTTGYLTVDTPFANGEAARNVTYTAPGSNKMQDLAGNLLANIAGASITNNVSGGTGTATLKWLPATADGANAGASTTASFKVYWGTTQGGPYPNSATAAGGSAAVTHTVSGLTNGLTWYFVVVAVDASGYESVVINEVSKAV